MEYRGYKIYHNFNFVDKHNPISGHHWREPVEAPGFKISGKGSDTRVFKTLKAAHAHIDFLIKFPFTPPRSEREIAKAKALVRREKYETVGL